MMDAAVVTVLMPVHNAGRYVREAVDSILGQTYPHLDVLAIDDGSTDDGRAILESYDDPRLRVVANPEQLGLIRTLNRGLEMVTGAFIARMDADDVALPTRIAEQLEYLERWPEVGFVSSAYESIDEQGGALPITYGLYRPVGHVAVRWSLHFGSYFCHPGCTARREAFDRVGAYDPSYPHAEDYELWLRAARSVRLDNIPKTLMRLRRHGENQSVVNRQIQRKSALAALHKSVEELIGAEVPLARVEMLRDFTKPTSSEELLGVGRLIDRLVERFVAEVSMSADEARVIRQDAVHRLADWVGCYASRFPRAAATLAMIAGRLAPVTFAAGLWGAHRRGIDIYDRSPLFVHVGRSTA